MVSERVKMLNGQLYDASDSELSALRAEARANIVKFQNESNREKNSRLLKEWLGGTGANITINPGFVCDYGCHIYVGENFYANFNCTFLDVCKITIGDNAMIGPNCQLLTPLHPIEAKKRIKGLEYGAPITIGHNVWLGGGVTILPGVTLGNNVVVGAGSVVTKSFGNDLVLAGNPARIIKRLGNETVEEE
ncbi:sugar O-acetyltransferase [Streptococcus chenjunshii]|uniref:Acetyltransferase n=1 Tax=Streptococcus chenjunshii TaxID=2173853 RepID=A0A372KQ45_9STRE|nr:sugar O-acetyltransferase [Streptococcus chenjunshii]AXQ78684.1 sugar O-acetyltransferase [Streptococcus chenjunshii]RFU51723.1 sugar O-acetyltransferase [Streptococcus chenjunshii]RFU54044.1 sugar O-acetyltransferase [Streptococcus chenjunshii]